MYVLRVGSLSLDVCDEHALAPQHPVCDGGLWRGGAAALHGGHRTRGSTADLAHLLHAHPLRLGTYPRWNDDRCVSPVATTTTTTTTTAATSPSPSPNPSTCTCTCCGVVHVTPGVTTRAVVCVTNGAVCLFQWPRGMQGIQIEW